MTKPHVLAVAMLITFCFMTGVLSVAYHTLLGNTAWLIIVPTSIIYGVGWVVCYLILIGNDDEKK